MCKVGLKSLRGEFATAVLEAGFASNCKKAETKAAVWDLAGLCGFLVSALDVNNQKFNRFIELPEISPL